MSLQVFNPEGPGTSLIYFHLEMDMQITQYSISLFINAFAGPATTVLVMTDEGGKFESNTLSIFI